MSNDLYAALTLQERAQLLSEYLECCGTRTAKDYAAILSMLTAVRDEGYKAGMEEAAKIAEDFDSTDEHAYKDCSTEIAAAILAASEEKK